MVVLYVKHESERSSGRSCRVVYLVMMNGEQKVGIILKHDRRKAERVSLPHADTVALQRGMCLAKIFEPK